MHKPKRRKRRWIVGIILLLATIVLLRAFLFHLALVQGTSMETTLSGGDIALVCSYLPGHEPDRGDIVECSFPGRSGVYIKRLIGLPGEYVDISSGQLHIDGAPLSEPYATGPMEDYSIQLAADEYLLLGDNRSESYDSRAADMGPVQRENILGYIPFILWPLGWAN